jgi:4-hydroxybenzoyl-CoA thioesterase
VAKVGNRSAVLWYRMHHAGPGRGPHGQIDGDFRLACELKHTVVTTDLGTLTSCDMPPDVRALLLQHTETPG